MRSENHVRSQHGHPAARAPEPAHPEPRRFKVFTARQLDKITQLERLDEDTRFAMRVVANVLPFRVNEYVIEDLIDWDKVPEDPIYQLTFPQKDMLAPEHFDKVAEALRGGDKEEIDAAVADVREALNPHPAGQMEHNIPEVDGEKIDGIQHKYAETVLFFPSQGQVCHSYCTFCFRWAQFIGDNDLKIAAKEAGQLKRYVQAHPEITDILITGGDPLVMKTKNLRAHIDRCWSWSRSAPSASVPRPSPSGPTGSCPTRMPRICWICSARYGPPASIWL